MREAAKGLRAFQKERHSVREREGEESMREGRERMREAAKGLREIQKERLRERESDT
ncbi:hypothetical protein F2Q68_00017370 [Brassica cretica]|uniref:Uncharacterized protein n=1 Tax=Brassica cretica TaxID=69181 RepID=A0A8S9HCS9_BRACR|nr:hypothetical protein F2Q68_00017370 [Brassica cretica]